MNWTNLTLSVLVFAVLAMPTRAQDSDSSTKRMLDPARQRAVWDSEHITFKIERRFGPWFLDAMRKRDPQLLEAAFQEEFSGAVLDDSGPREKRSKGEIEELRRTAGARAVGAGADGVVAGLLAHLEELADIEGLGRCGLQISAGGEGRWDARVLLTASGRGLQSSWWRWILSTRSLFGSVRLRIFTPGQ